VQIDEVRIGKHQLHSTEGVRRPGILSQCVRDVAAVKLRPIDRAGIQLSSIRIQYLQSLACDRVRIAPCRGQDVVLDDSRRNRPRGIEDHVAELRTKNRRAPIRLADLRARGPDELPRTHQVSRETGDVHDHELIGQIVQQHAPTIEIDAQLPDALGERHIELGYRAWTGDAIALQSHPPLERAYCCLERGVVSRGVARLADIQIAACNQACAQRRNSRIAHSRGERRSCHDCRPVSG
jgi:hypothetical protein